MGLEATIRETARRFLALYVGLTMLACVVPTLCSAGPGSTRA